MESIDNSTNGTSEGPDCVESAAGTLPNRNLPTKSFRKPETGYIYFIGGECECIKIGFARDPHSRLRSLQVGSPVKLFLLACTPGEVADERDYHRKFRASWSHGEWFRRTPQLLALINGLKRQENHQRSMRGLRNA